MKPTPPPVAPLLTLASSELAGTAAAMGEAFGEQCRTAIHELYEIRLADAIASAAKLGRLWLPEQVLALCRRCLPLSAAYAPLGHAEFLGIARGAGLAPEQLYAMQGLTDLRDVLAYGPPPDGEGCSSFIVAGERTAAGHLLLGQTWDLHTSNLPYIRLVHRRPSDGPATWSLTLTGCLTLIGLNEAGLAVGNTNLQTTDARVGVQYLAVLHRALRARTLAEAGAAIAQAPRAAAHYYYAADARQAIGLECSATRVATTTVTQGHYTHCNHPLHPEIRALAAQAPLPSTLSRQQRLDTLLTQAGNGISVADLQTMLNDHAGGPATCICRHDHEGVSTNAVVIMEPATRTLHACRGQGHLAQWETRRF